MNNLHPLTKSLQVFFRILKLVFILDHILTWTRKKLAHLCFSNIEKYRDLYLLIKNTVYTGNSTQISYRAP